MSDINEPGAEQREQAEGSRETVEAEIESAGTAERPDAGTDDDEERSSEGDVSPGAGGP